MSRKEIEDVELKEKVNRKKLGVEANGSKRWLTVCKLFFRLIQYGKKNQNQTYDPTRNPGTYQGDTTANIKEEVTTSEWP